MLEGEATQEQPAPEDAQTPAPPEADEEQTEASASPAEGESTQPAEPETAEIAETGETATDAQPVVALDWSHLRGFQSVEPASAELAAREDYALELAKELTARAARFARSVDDSIVLSSDGVLRWLGDPVARIVSGDDLLRPRSVLLADDALSGEDRASVENRVALWLAAHVRKVLGPLVTLAEGVDLPDAARAVAAKIADALGVLERERVRVEVRSLDQSARGALRKLGVRFGSLYIYVPLLLKPGARGLCTLLWTIKRGSEAGADRLLAYAAAGRTSFANEGLLSPDAYRIAGFRLCGERVVRVDIIERLSDLIRAAIPDHMRSGSRPATEAYGFQVSPQMTSLTGCSGEAFASILRSLGFEPTLVGKAAFEAANRKAPTEPIKPAGGEADPAPMEDASAAAEPHEEAEASGGAETAAQEPVAVEAEAVEDSAPDDELAAVEEPAEAVEAVAEPAQEDAAQEEAAQAGTAEVTEAESAALEAAATPEEPEVLPQEAMAQIETQAVEAASAAPQDAPAGEEQIEIWRPAPRRPRAPHRPHGAEAREGRQAHGKGHRRHGRTGEAKPAEAGAPVEAVAPAAAPVEDARPPRHQRQRREEGQPRYEGRPQAEPTRDERRPQKEHQRREQRPVDPDSPFAKLAALKPLLERRDKRP